jgi:Ca2+-binding RTX toxin-like protein
VHGLSRHYNLATGSGFLAVRKRPISSSRMVHQLFNGDRVEITDRSGNWYFVGGNGWDVADYSRQFSSGPFDPVYNPTGGVRIDLRITGAQDTRGAGSDTLINVENVIGTGWDDTLIGNDYGNVLEGGAGADRQRGNVCAVSPGSNQSPARDGAGADMS